jgi:hypothetical protein
MFVLAVKPLDSSGPPLCAGMYCCNHCYSMLHQASWPWCEAGIHGHGFSEPLHGKHATHWLCVFTAT